MNRRRLIATAAAVATAALGLAACGGGDDGSGFGTTDLFDTGDIFDDVTETDFLPPAEEEPPPAAEPPADGTILQITVPPPGQPVGPQSPTERIAEVQSALLALGFRIGEADGVFGAKTRNAVERFQRNQRLQVDGLVGPRTARALNRALRQAAAG